MLRCRRRSRVTVLSVSVARLQIQLVAQLSATAGSAYSRALRRRKLAAQPVELQHMAAANNGATNVFRLWNVDTERPPAAAPGAGKMASRNSRDSSQSAHKLHVSQRSLCQ